MFLVVIASIVGDIILEASSFGQQTCRQNENYEKADVVSDEGKAPGFGDGRWRHSGCRSPFGRRFDTVGFRAEHNLAFACRR
jgi:hypothetical protein